MQDFEDTVYSPCVKCGSRKNHWTWWLRDVCGSSAILLAVHLARTTIEPLQCVSDKYHLTGCDQQEDLATLDSVQLRQTLSLWTLASRLPGERPLLEMNGDILWIQQRCSGIRCERRKKELSIHSNAIWKCTYLCSSFTTHLCPPISCQCLGFSWSCLNCIPYNCIYYYAFHCITLIGDSWLGAVLHLLCLLLCLLPLHCHSHLHGTFRIDDNGCGLMPLNTRSGITLQWVAEGDVLCLALLAIFIINPLEIRGIYNATWNNMKLVRSAPPWKGGSRGN